MTEEEVLAAAPVPAGVASVHTPFVLHPDLPEPADTTFEPDPRSAAGYGYAPGTRASSAGWPRTPSQLKVQQPRPNGYDEYGAKPKSHSKRGGRPGQPVPRHLQSTVQDIIFGGGEGWASESGMRGYAGGVGGAKLHEIGHTRTPCGHQTREDPQGPLQTHVFGAPPPTRPTVGSRAHLSRAHMNHMRSTAEQVIWAHSSPA